MLAERCTQITFTKEVYQITLLIQMGLLLQKTFLIQFFKTIHLLLMVLNQLLLYRGVIQVNKYAPARMRSNNSSTNLCFVCFNYASLQITKMLKQKVLIAIALFKTCLKRLNQKLCKHQQKANSLVMNTQSIKLLLKMIFFRL